MSSKDGSQKWWSDTPPTVRRIVVGVLLGAATFVVSQVDQSNLTVIEQLTLAIVVSGVAVIVQFFGEVEIKLTELKESQEAARVSTNEFLEVRFAKISEATSLFSAVEASAIETNIVTQFVRHATNIESTVPDIVKSFAGQEITRISQFLKELNEGGGTYDGEDRDWLLGLAASACHSIDATSLTTVDAGGSGFYGGFWTSDLGQRYLELQERAVSRGVKIRRVFILDRSELADDPLLLEVCTTQKDLGIDVRVLDPSSLAPTKKVALFDFIVFDGVVSYEVTPASIVDPTVPPAILRTQLELYSPRVAERIDKFADLWEVAESPSGP